MNENFTHKMARRDIDMFSPCTYLEDGSLTIDYSIEFETKEWGIKSICLNINKIYGELTAEIEDEATDLLMQDPLVKTYEIEATDDLWTIKKHIDWSSKGSFILYPTNCEIDVDNKQIEVYF